MPNIDTPDIFVPSLLETDFTSAIFDTYPDYPFHNFGGHVLSALDYFDEITKELSMRGVYLNQGVGHLALLGHDAGFHWNHERQNMDSKEALAANLSVCELEKLGASLKLRGTVRNAILATHVCAEPITNLEKAVRLADVGNVTDVEDEFIANFALNIQEAVLLEQPLPKTFKEQCAITQSFLRLYFPKPAYVFKTEDGSEVILEDRESQAQHNLNKLDNLTLDELLEKIKLFGLELPEEVQIWNRRTN